MCVSASLLRASPQLALWATRYTLYVALRGLDAVLYRVLYITYYSLAYARYHVHHARYTCQLIWYLTPYMIAAARTNFITWARALPARMSPSQLMSHHIALWCLYCTITLCMRTGYASYSPDRSSRYNPARYARSLRRLVVSALALFPNPCSYMTSITLLNSTANTNPVAITLPYLGPWTPHASDTHDAHAHTALLDAHGAHTHTALLDPPPCAAPSITRLPNGAYTFTINPDSGCTGHVTPYKYLLTNLRPCKESFRQANGDTTICDWMGDLPMVAKDSNGKAVQFTITNVRYVHTFKYTLISVDQLWHEQRIDSRFRDLHRLQFPRSAGGIRIPYDPASRLNSIAVGSLARLPGGNSNTPVSSSCKSAATKSLAPSPEPPVPAVTTPACNDKPKPTQPKQSTKHSALLFHRPKSTSYISGMPASRAGELMHRRCHLGHAKIRALHNASKDAPKNLSAFQADDHTCPDCA